MKPKLIDTYSDSKKEYPFLWKKTIWYIDKPENAYLWFADKIIHCWHILIWNAIWVSFYEDKFRKNAWKIYICNK